MPDAPHTLRVVTPVADEATTFPHEARDSSGKRKKRPHAGRWDGLLCGLLFLAAVLASRPFVEMGLIDDFSYVKTAFIFARTGHLVYNGWATAMLGAQIVWAAPFIKLLGYSFFATRVSTLVTAFFCVWVTHGIMRRVGLNRTHAVCGTLTLGLSPLFVPLSITFMTDISGLFAIIVAIYCCLRALEATSTRSAILWLVLGNIAGLLGGTTRQIAWAAVIVLMPTAAWILRKRRGVLLAGSVLWLLSIASIVACMEWFKHRPLIVPEHLIAGRLDFRTLRELAGTMLAAALCLALVTIPELTSTLPRIRRIRLGPLAAIIAGSLAATWVCHFITYHLDEKGLLPWTRDIIDKIGLYEVPNAWFLGVAPSAFSVRDRLIGSVLVLFTLIVFIYVIRTARPSPQAEHAEQPSWATLAALLAPFTAFYIALLIPRGMWEVILDRYLLPLIVIAAIALLRLHQERVSARVPAITWATLALLGAFSVLGTHDWIASHKARLAAVRRLETAGVPPTKIEAGYEFDGTTQIDSQGVVYDPRVHYPTGMIIHPYEPDGIAPDCTYLFNQHTPAVHAEYFLAYQQVDCLGPSSFSAESYHAWLPPFRREILILQRSR